VLIIEQWIRLCFWYDLLLAPKFISANNIFPKGPIVWAPLSEEYGRKYITIINFILFTLFTMSCALAPTWKTFLVFRLLSGAFGSSVVSIAPGILSDVYHDPGSRGWSIAIFMAVCIIYYIRITIYD
jgi:MFS family permease